MALAECHAISSIHKTQLAHSRLSSWYKPDSISTPNSSHVGHHDRAKTFAQSQKMNTYLLSLMLNLSSSSKFDLPPTNSENDFPACRPVSLDLVCSRRSSIEIVVVARLHLLVVLWCGRPFWSSLVERRRLAAGLKAKLKKRPHVLSRMLTLSN